ncbi:MULTISPECIES: hypothetical protein [Cyanophyceae]|uniref:Uncharacterized protein n=1 Tax=Leptolyngbya subtilissima DQ-A4 TaxID=2933933 RepID=A0ABV0K7T4_9CYAN|nr:hypothetical protein [Nodosilinea sp. FACHB-141]MBD2110512.1 hypothetical protein [Nodosilinea sp. FACHB-141]
MTTSKIHISLKMIAKRLTVLFVTVVALFGFSQTAALASPTPSSLVALAASSRFAAQAESEALKTTIPEEKLSEMREQRREWQNKAATTAAAAAEAGKKPKSSAGELIKDKLNLDEITEENEIVETITNSQKK